MNARSLTITTPGTLAEVPAHARNHGIVAMLSTPTAEDAAELLGGTDARDLTNVNFYVDGEWHSETTYETPRGDIAASERFDRDVKATLVRLRKQDARAFWLAMRQHAELAHLQPTTPAEAAQLRLAQDSARETIAAFGPKGSN